MTPKNLDSFDKYYEGKMSLEEQENFEMALHSNSNLYHAFREYMSTAIDIHIYANTDQSKKTEVTVVKPKPQVASLKQFVLKKYLFLAAAVFLVCLLLHPVYQDYAILSDMPHTFGRQASKPMGNSHVTPSLFNDGLVLRDNKQYEAAIQKFEQIEKTSAYYDNACFEKALIYLKEGKYTAANVILKDIIANSEKEVLRKKASAVQDNWAIYWFGQ